MQMWRMEPVDSPHRVCGALGKCSLVSADTDLPSTLNVDRVLRTPYTARACATGTQVHRYIPTLNVVLVLRTIAASPIAPPSAAHVEMG